MRTFTFMAWIENNIRPHLLTSLDRDSIAQLGRAMTIQGELFKEQFARQIDYPKGRPLQILLLLVSCSNRVHYFLYRLVPAWLSSAASPTIRSLYQRALLMMESLLAECATLAPLLFGRLHLTRNAMPQAVLGLKEKFARLRYHMADIEIDHELRALLEKGLYTAIRNRKITNDDVSYAHCLMDALIMAQRPASEQLALILYRHGFNQPDFIAYCFKEWNNAIISDDGLYEQLEMVIREEDRVNGIPVTENRLLPDRPHLKDLFLTFLSEKKIFIKQMLKLRRAIMLDEQSAKFGNRPKINLSVALFALFIRVQMEKGLLPKDNVGKLFHFFAANFQTSQTTFISAESLQKKSTDVEFATAVKLKGHLINMLNWLNENYNLSNFRE